MLHKDKQNRIYSVNYGDGIFRTTDLGNSWTRIFVSQTVFGFAIDSSGNLYAGNFDGNIYKSTNDGYSWRLSYLANIPYSSIIAISASPDGNIYATSMNEGVLRSTNSGSSWSIVKHQTSTGSFGWWPIAVDQRGYVYTTGYGNKFYVSKDEGETWLDITSNLELIDIWDIQFDKQNKIYIATDDGIWWSNQDSILSLDKDEKITSYSLSQNFPNPFNPSTKIKYTIAKEGNVSLQLYDVLGNKIKTLINSEQEPGEYEYEFDGSSLASGTYFYQLKSGEFIETKKLIIIK